MKKLFFSLCCLLAACFGGTSLEARRSRASAPQMISPSVDPAIAELAGQYRDIEMVVEKAKRDAAEVQRQARRSVDESNSRADRRHSRMSRRKEDMLRRERERKAIAERKARERAEEIRKQAEADSLRIIQEAEKRALDLRNKLEAQEEYDRTNSKPEITTEWQREVRREFANDSAFMKQIIIEGETSRLEKQDFVALFEEQEKWFEEQVKGTTHFFDESYTAVMRKKNALSVLVDAQRQADELLAELIHQHHLSTEVHQQLRVAALYEINDYLQKEDKREVFIAGDIVRTLVASVAEDAIPGYKTVKITTEKEKIERLSQRVAELESGEVPEGDDFPGVNDDFSGANDDFPGLDPGSSDSGPRIKSGETAFSDSDSSDWVDEEESVTIEPSSLTDDDEDDDDWAEEGIKQIEEAGSAAISQVTADAEVKLQKLREDKDAEVEAVAAEKVRLEKERDETIARITADKESAVAALKKEMAAQREAARKEQEQAHAELTGKLKSSSGELFKLQDEVARLRHESAQMKAKHERERSSLKEMVGSKQEEKVALEASLSQLAEQLRLLSTTSQERLLQLASQMSQEKVQQEHLQRVLARKTREKVELERTLGKVHGQLQTLHITTDKLIAETTARFEKSQKRFDEMQSQLAAKQKHTTELELALSALQNRLSDAAGVLQHASVQFTVMEERNSALSERLATLHAQVQSLRERLPDANEAEVPEIQDTLQNLAAQTNDGIQELRDKVSAQRIALTHRQKGYNQMHKLEKQMTQARHFRKADPSRDQAQADLLDQLTSYGENLTSQHQQVGDAADRLAGTHGELEQVIEMLMPESADEHNAPDVTRLEEGAAWLSELLGDMGGIEQQLPDHHRAPARMGSPRTMREALMEAHHETEDDEEEIHDPADEPEAPEVYHPDEDDEGEGEDLDDFGDDFDADDNFDDFDTEEDDDFLEEDALAILDDEEEDDEDEDEEESEEENTEEETS